MSLLTDASLLLTPNANATSKLYSIIPSNGNGDFTGTRATTATRVNSSGLIETTAINMIRRDYSLGGCPNILLEPQRTNLALQSSSFDNIVWDKNNTTVTANTTTSPSGVTDADTIQRDGVLSSLTLAQDISVTLGVTYTLSVYAKKNTNNFIQLTGRSTSFATTSFANFDLNNGVVGTVGATATATITNVGNGWYLCTATMAATGTASIDSMMIHLVTSASSVRLEPNTLSTSVFLWGAQLEAGAYATSYIPTTTASVTRNADSITRNNIFTNGLITSAGGTWFVELRNNLSVTRDATSGGIFINTGNISTTGDGFAIRSANTTSRMSISKVIANTNTILFTPTTDTIKVAIKWNGSTADVFVNGVKQVSATAFTTTAMQNLIADGINRQAFINEMALFPTPLTDAQCIALTQ